jgi:cephalosporin-C deacetylase-like acetyl esterase
MLAIPKKPGKYPALLKLPGGGVYRYYGDPKTAAAGVITLEIGIHGIQVNLDPQVYADLSNGALFYYYSIRMDDKDTYYFKRVNVGCVKAIDFIFSLPEFNGKDIALSGQSQGGDLSIVTAGLDKRVTYLAVLSPGGCDATGYLYNRPSGGPSFYKYVKIGPKEIETGGYYDAVNFARRITAPGYYSWGFNDVVCPPTSMYSAYNVITAPKEINIFQETGHWVFPEQWEVVYFNIRKHLMGQ